MLLLSNSNLWTPAGTVIAALTLVGGIIVYALGRFRVSLNTLRTDLLVKLAEYKQELLAEIAKNTERLNELEMSQTETNRLSIRAAAQTETLMQVFGTAGRPGGGRRSDPPERWPGG